MRPPAPPLSRPPRRWARRALGAALVALTVALATAAWLAPPFEADLPGDLAAYVPRDVAWYAGGRALMPLVRRAQALADAPHGRALMDSVPARDLDRRYGVARVLAGLAERTIPGVGPLNAALVQMVEGECACALTMGPGGPDWLAVGRLDSYAAKLACGAAIRAGASLGLEVAATELTGGLFLAKRADVVWLAGSRELLASAVACIAEPDGSLARDPRFAAAPAAPGEPALRVHVDLSRTTLGPTLAAWTELTYPFPLSLWPPLVLGELDMGDLTGATGWLTLEPEPSMSSAHRTTRFALAWRGVVFLGSSREPGWLDACRRGPAAAGTAGGATALRAIERLPDDAFAARALALAPAQLIERLRALEALGLGAFLGKYDQVARAVEADLDGAIAPRLDGELVLVVMDAPAADGAGEAGVGIACLLGCDRPGEVVAALDRVFEVPRETLGTRALARSRHGALEIRALGPVPILADGEPAYAAIGRAVAFATHPGLLGRLHDAARGAASTRAVPRIGPGARAVRATIDLARARDLVRRFARDIAVELVADYHLPPERARLAAESPGLSPAALDLALEARRVELTGDRARAIERGLGQYRLLDRFDLEWSPAAAGLELDVRLGVDLGVEATPRPGR